jgi:hypothetical protein
MAVAVKKRAMGTRAIRFTEDETGRAVRTFPKQ